MKWLVIIIGCMCMIACKKDPEFNNYKIKATISNKSMKSVPAIFYNNETMFSKTVVSRGEQIFVSGIKTGGEYSLVLSILNPTIGTFDLYNSMQANCSPVIPWDLSQNPNNHYTTSQGGSGSITVESLTDSTIIGSFNAICIGLNDTLTIINGTFSGNFN